MFFTTQFSAAESNYKRHSIGFVINPNYLSKTGSTLGEELSPETMEVFGISGYALGLRYNFSISKRIGFESGIQLTQRGIGSKSHMAVYYYPTSDIHGNLRALEGKSKYLYLDLPMLLNYQIAGQKRLIIHMKSGISLNVALNLKNDYSRVFDSGFIESDHQFFDFDELRKHIKLRYFNLTFFLSPELTYKATNRVSLALGPTLMYALLPSSKNNMKVRFLEIGMSFGTYYCF